MHSRVSTVTQLQTLDGGLIFSVTSDAVGVWGFAVVSVVERRGRGNEDV